MWWSAPLLTGTVPAWQTVSVSGVVARVEDPSRSSLTGTMPAWQTVLVVVEDLLEGCSRSPLTGTGPAWQTRVELAGMERMRAAGETHQVWVTAPLTGTVPAWQTVLRVEDLLSGCSRSPLTGTEPAWQTRVELEGM